MLNTQQIIPYKIVFYIFLLAPLKAEIQNNKFDPMAQATVKGINLYANEGEMKRQQSFVSFSITPYYQDASEARNSRSKSESGITALPNIGILEEFGPWNVAGIFYGIFNTKMKEDGNGANASAPEEGAVNLSSAVFFAPLGFEFSRQTSSQTGKGKTTSTEAEALIGANNWTSEKYKNYYNAGLKTIYTGLSDENLTTLSDTNSLGSYPTTNANLENYLDPNSAEFIKDNQSLTGFRSPQAKLQRYGARAHLSFSPVEGIKIFARGGVCELKVVPSTYTAISMTTNTPSAEQSALNEALVSDGAIHSALQDLGLSFKPYSNWSFEDAYVGVSAGQSFAFKDEEEDLVVTLSPMASVGVWLPVSHKYDGKAEGNKYLFYVPVGNEGHTGISFMAGVSMDFQDSITISMGAGGTVFNEINIKGLRMPNDPRQVGIYPFTTDVKRKMGEMVFAFASLRSIDFSYGASFYGDYVYMSHRKDKIDLTDSNTDRKAIFEANKQLFIDRTKWNTHEISAGIIYSVNENLELAMGLKVNVWGSLAPKEKSVLGSARFIF